MGSELKAWVDTRVLGRRDDRRGERAQKTGVGSGVRTRADKFFYFVEKGIYAMCSRKGPKHRRAEWVQKTGVRSGIRTQVDTFFHFVKKGMSEGRSDR